ncbi:MAG: hypothetical protein ACRD4C_02025 [Candidatus Acidiferrales bacterium]
MPCGDTQRKSATQGQIATIEDRLKGAEKWMIWLTAAIALFVLCSVIVGALQWSVIKGGSVDTHALAKSAKTQAAKMGNMSDAADKIQQAARDMAAQEKIIADNAQMSLKASNAQSQKVFNASINSAHLDQRAWVVVKGIANKPELNKPWTPQVVFTNTGKTPARDVLASCNCSAGKGDSLPRTLKAVPYGFPNFIAPNDQFYCTLQGSPKIEQPNLDALESQAVEVFIYGSVTYEDVFGNHHWLTFCRIMLPDGSGWNPCKTYNDTGDGEKPPPN